MKHMCCGALQCFGLMLLLKCSGVAFKMHGTITDNTMVHAFSFFTVMQDKMCVLTCNVNVPKLLAFV